MSNSVLVVVDMQEDFLHDIDYYSRSCVIDNCAKLINSCSFNSDPIIFVEWHDEYGELGPTTFELKNLVKLITLMAT